MKVLLDTNVIIAAFITRGVCSELLDHCIQHHVLITPEFILNEFREHMIHKFGYAVEEVEEAVELLELKMQTVKPSPLKNSVCRDPDDDIVLGTAVAGDVACIVTGLGFMKKRARNSMPSHCLHCQMGLFTTPL